MRDRLFKGAQMVARQHVVAVIVLGSVLMPAAGCTSMKPIRPATQPGAPTFGRLKAGDTVEITTRDGRTARFVVQQVDGEVIIAPDGVRYTTVDIAQVKRRSFSGPKTAGLIAGIFAGVLIVAAAAVATALDGLWGG
jgi:hypothetical protein